MNMKGPKYFLAFFKLIILIKNKLVLGWVTEEVKMTHVKNEYSYNTQNQN